jgi:DNA end-binding protein Ku
MGSKRLGFGLVNVNVKLYSATSDKAATFHQITREGNRVRQNLVDAVTGKPVADRSELRKGYEYAKGECVIVEPTDLAALATEGDGIELMQFVAPGEIDAIYYDKAYLLGPDTGAERAYGLLVAALRQTGRVGIAVANLRDRDHLVAIRAEGSVLTMTTLFYADEIVGVGDLALDSAAPDRAELAEAVKLVAGRTSKFVASAYHDEYRKRVAAFLDAEVTRATKPSKATQKPVADLMGALKASVEAAKADQAPRKARRKVAA